MRSWGFLLNLCWVTLCWGQQTHTNSIGMEFVKIPAGSFKMGTFEDPFSSKHVADDEKPQHEVVITKSFYLGKYEVTQEQWVAVMGENPSNFKTEELGHDSRKNPVEQVSWEDAQEFIKRLNAKEGGQKYRLPTEAEWEYACRAGSTGAYCFGDDESQLGQYAWFDGNSGDKTHPVGQKKPNAWGLYDMHGNVSEWCQDWYDEDYYARSPKNDPAGPSSGSERVIRGGSWYDRARDCRSAYRIYYSPGGRYFRLGFRLLRTYP